ncbi:MAG: divalent-cation tolerance protein CutA [Acidobacteria bacterium]|nr:divalent-cation tolerance protein CutA [Acidobacteriota bacterium]
MRAFDSVYITFPSLESAQTLAKKLLEGRFIGCANIFPSVESWYQWQGAIQCDSEVVLIAKAPRRNRSTIIDTVLAMHPYKVPCVLFREIADGSGSYLDWLDGETSDNGPG